MALGGQPDPEPPFIFEENWETSISDARHSLYEDTYGIEFCFKTRGARDFTTVISDEFVVRLDTDEKKEKMAKIQFSVTEMTMDHDKRVVKARYKRGSVTNVEKWKQDVRKIIEAEGIEVVSVPDFNQEDTWEIVHVGLKANEASTQIKRQVPGVCCHVIQDKLSLLLYSRDSKHLQRAVEMATEARPSGGLSSEFTTPRAGIKVCFVSADITYAPTEAVVSATDKNLSFGGGVSKAIKRVVDQEMEEECRAFLQTNKILEETQVIETTGKPRWKYVIHAHGPEWPRLSSSQEKKDRCRDLLTDTVYNCIQRAAMLTIASVAIPFISSQAFRVPHEVCADSFKAAIERFDQDVEDVDVKHLTLKTIIFMDIARAKVSKVQRSISQSDKLRAETTLRVVLVGKTGTGKSSTGNSILGKNAFDPKEGWASVTNRSHLARHDTMGLEVVDTPGLFDLPSGEKEHEQNIMKEIMKGVVLCLPGPHAFLLVFNGKGRFTTHEKDVLEKLHNVFSEMIMQFVIIVFTHVPDDDTLKKHIDSAPPDVNALLKKFREKGRIVAIDNEGPECKKQAEYIIRMAVKVRYQNGGQGAYYEDDLIHRCLQLIKNEDFTDMSVEDIMEAVMKENPDLVPKLIENTHTIPAAKLGCNIL